MSCNNAYLPGIEPRPGAATTMHRRDRPGIRALCCVHKHHAGQIEAIQTQGPAARPFLLHGINSDGGLT
jgi:hypothetical protein